MCDYIGLIGFGAGAVTGAAIFALGVYLGAQGRSYTAAASAAEETVKDIGFKGESVVLESYETWPEKDGA